MLTNRARSIRDVLSGSPSSSPAPAASPPVGTAGPLKLLPTSHSLADKLLGLDLFTPAQQAAHQMTFVNGLLCSKDPTTGKPTPLTTTGNVEKAFVPRTKILNRSLFAFLPGDRFITSLNDVTGIVSFTHLYKHPTLSGGAPSGANGEIEVEQGQIKYINNCSGHYQPNLGVWIQLLKWLEGQGVDLSQVKLRVRLFPPAGSDSQVGYAQVRSPEAAALGRKLKLGAFRGEEVTVEGQRLYNFEFGQAVAALGAPAKIEMVHTLAGPVPGKVLREAARRGYGPFDSIVVGRTGVTYKFDPVAESGPMHYLRELMPRHEAEEKAAAEQMEIKVPLTELKALGLELDQDHLTRSAEGFDTH